MPMALTMHHPARASYMAKAPPRVRPATLSHPTPMVSVSVRSKPATIRPAVTESTPLAKRAAFPFASILHCGIDDSSIGEYINDCFYNLYAFMEPTEGLEPPTV